MRHSQPSPGAIRFVARDLDISYEKLVNILVAFGYLELDNEQVYITSKGREAGVYDTRNGGIGINENIITEVQDWLQSQVRHCWKCGKSLEHQGIYPPSATHWKCIVCGADNDLTQK